MRKYLIVLFALFIPISVFAQTKTTTAVDEWENIAQNAVREGTEVDISGDFALQVHIKIAITTDGTAHTGTKIELQTSGNTTGNEDWTPFKTLFSPTGTPNSEATSGTETAGATVIECASTVGLYDDDESRQIFFLHTTVANSEMVRLVSHVANVSVTLQDGIGNDQTAGVMYDIARSFVVPLPFGEYRFRILYDNTFDSDGSTVHTYARISRVTAL